MYGVQEKAELSSKFLYLHIWAYIYIFFYTRVCVCITSGLDWKCICPALGLRLSLVAHFNFFPL